MTELASASNADSVSAGIVPEPEGGLVGHELEVKFRTGAEGLKLAMASPVFADAAPSRAQHLQTIYFDTPSNDLRNNGIVLRVRKRARATPVLAVKSVGPGSGGPFLRTEIEVRSPDLQPNLSLFDASTAAKLNDIVGQQPLEAKFETRIRRRTLRTAVAGSNVEAAFDEGHIDIGDVRMPLTEVELELKSGEESDLCDLAIRLAETLPLRLDFESKAEKGFRLAMNEKPEAVKAGAIDFGPEATLDDAIVTIISHTLGQFAANWAALLEGGEVESIHQLRVSLRRMRSGLSIIRRAVPHPEFDGLRDEAKRLATAFGPARNCDVIGLAAEQGPFSCAARPAGSEGLLAAIEDRRIAAYRNARALLDDAGPTLFVLRVQSLVARRAWRTSLPEAGLQVLTQPATAFARAALDKLLVRVKKRGEGLSGLDDEARHKLRIAFKNLRYGVDFFGGLFGHRRKFRSYAEKISKMQDILGAHNDVVTARKFLDGLTPALGPEQERASGFVLGWFARELTIADERLLASWKKFKKAGKFWD